MRKKLKQLDDRDWLYQQYIVERKSLRKIASEIGAKSPTSVRMAVKNFNLQTTRPRRTAPKGTSSYNKLNDLNWLKEEYLVQKRCLNDIADEIGCSSGVIYDFLKTKGIPIRTKKEAYVSRQNKGEIVFNKNTWNIIYGCLLGDGFLRKTLINSNATFGKKNIHYDHIEFVAKNIFDKNYAKTISGPHTFVPTSVFKNERMIENPSPFYVLQSLVHKELTDIYENWYSKEKIIPKELSLNPVILLHWFLDDGYSYYHKDGVRIGLCSQSFSYKENERLVGLLFRDLCIDARVGTNDGYPMIFLKTKKTNVQKFFDIIGPCPIKSFEYKWKL